VRLLKWTLFFAVSFVVSWILITTFSQWQFQTGAPVRIVTYQTREFPLYFYAAATFLIGLTIGLSMAVYNYVTLQARLRGKAKEARRLEEQVAGLRRELDMKVSAVKEAEEQREEARRAAEVSARVAAVEHEDEFLDKEEEVGGALDTEESESADEPPGRRDTQ
jgi:uncharacterized membrane protein YciS (DUF1049 family)